ncbi:hypothetical protein TNIN_175191 [Trichonephila inaurata madagascariensis]|uniref:Uncharacterized protein n=1 Tax=Trichonephila inaurata madagascariensis TaxID=2747483 RepID=A0A8X6XLY8_9ARAC|nr:hypothetical protein TNIN_175191 [Trichonephila inaurata madagascariensis]
MFVCKYIKKGSDMAVFDVTSSDSNTRNEVHQYEMWGGTSVVMNLFGGCPPPLPVREGYPTGTHLSAHLERDRESTSLSLHRSSLIIIEDKVRSLGELDLKSIGLPQPNQDFNTVDDVLRERTYNVSELRKSLEENEDKRLPDQREIFQKITESVFQETGVVAIDNSKRKRKRVQNKTGEVLTNENALERLAAEESG